ncbi:hypothetical protein ACTA71_000043 [Dictyostelium dimigraforme]
MKDYLIYSILLKGKVLIFKTQDIIFSKLLNHLINCCFGVVITIPKDIHFKALLKIHDTGELVADNGSEDQDIQADYSSYLARVLKFTWKNIKNRDDSKSSKVC